MTLRMTALGTRLTAVLLVAAATCLSGAQTFSQYLQLRRQHGISQAAGVPALETLVGSRTVEIKGIVKGRVKAGDRYVFMLERTDGESEMVSSSFDVPWLAGNATPARLLVRAVREQENGYLRATLIGAAAEPQMAAYEGEQRRKREAERKGRAATIARPNPTRPTRTTLPQTWDLEPNEATPHYAAFIRSYNRRLSNEKAMEIANAIINFSLRYGVDARLIMAMVLTESGFRPEAVSRAGARGLGQLMPGTARALGVRDPHDTNQNLWGTVRYIRGHIERFQARTGDDYQGLILALAAYNAGSGAVRRHGGVPPFRETQNYVRKVMGLYRQFSGLD